MLHGNCGGGGGGVAPQHQILQGQVEYLYQMLQDGGECTCTSCYKEIWWESVPKPNATRLGGSTYTGCYKEMGEGGSISIPDTTRFG